MVKFGKHKMIALNKLAKKQIATGGSPSTNNKVLKKKINVEKKVSFQKEVLLKEAAETNSLVKNVTGQEIILKKLAKKTAKKIQKPEVDTEIPKPKVRAVEKKKKRHNTLVQDTRMLLKLINKK